MLLADIRFCTKDHLERLLEIDRSSPYPWLESVIVRDLVEGDTNVSYLGAFAPVDEDILMGYAVLGDEKGCGLLMNLVVLTEYRRRGIGAQLVVAVAECAFDMGFPELVLRVRYLNTAAIALYRSLGFKADATRESYYSNGDAAQYMSARLPLVFTE